MSELEEPGITERELTPEELAKWREVLASKLERMAQDIRTEHLTLDTLEEARELHGMYAGQELIEIAATGKQSFYLTYEYPEVAQDYEARKAAFLEAHPEGEIEKMVVGD